MLAGNYVLGRAWRCSPTITGAHDAAGRVRGPKEGGMKELKKVSLRWNFECGISVRGGSPQLQKSPNVCYFCLNLLLFIHPQANQTMTVDSLSFSCASHSRARVQKKTVGGLSNPSLCGKFVSSKCTREHRLLHLTDPNLLSSLCAFC